MAIGDIKPSPGGGYTVTTQSGTKHANTLDEAQALLSEIPGIAGVLSRGVADARYKDSESKASQVTPDPAKDYYYGSPDEQKAHSDYLKNKAAWEAFNQGTNGWLSGYSELAPPELVEQPGALARADRNDQAIYDQQGIYNDQMVARNNAILDQLSGNVDAMVSRNQGYVDDLSSAYASLNASDQAALGNYINTVNGIELAPVSLASSNPQDVARQEQAYGMLMGAASGSLDAHSNPEDVARQSKAADKLWGLTDTELTAEERFIMERARMEEEQDRRGAMDAALRNLAARGQLGSGHEIGANLGAQQITSQNRMLQDLGALANASQRSMSALNSYSNLATNMRNASDAMTSGNMDRRLGGMQGAASTANSMRNASDAIATFNSAQQNRWNEVNTDLQMGKATGIVNQTRLTNDSAGNRAGSLANTGVDASWKQYQAQNGLANTGLTASGLQAAGDNLLNQIAQDANRDSYNRGESALGFITQREDRAADRATWARENEEMKRMMQQDPGILGMATKWIGL